MKHAIETLQHELKLITDGLKEWRSVEYQDIKKRQEKKAEEIKKAIQILTNA